MNGESSLVLMLLTLALTAGIFLGSFFTETRVKPEQFDKAKKTCVEVEWVSPDDLKCKTQE